MNDLILSVICPVYNGEKTIKQLLEFLLISKPYNKEIILIDGYSNDNTVSIIQNFQQINDNIILLYNKKKYVPFALNMSLKICKGRYIARVDAHTEYPHDYFLQCLSIAELTGADNVGGSIQSLGNGPIGEAIAFAMSSTFGVGNSGFRTLKQDAYVETVPFGFWPKEVFEKYGLFDEDLFRNQDDEFNYRIIANGGKVFQSVKIDSKYYVRNSFISLYRQYFQYGLFKPLVIKKIGKVVRIRHLVPVFFVLYLFFLPILFLFSGLFILPIIAYFIVGFYFASKSRFISNTFLAFMILHFSYGFGFLRGIFLKNPSKQFIG